MNYLYAYFLAVYRFLTIYGIIYLFAHAATGEPIAIYCLGISFLVSVVGPIAYSLNKKEKQ